MYCVGVLLAAARYSGDPVFADLRDAVLAASHHAHTWWADHDVLPSADGIKLFCQPNGRPPKPLRRIVLPPANTRDQKLVVYLPVPASMTAPTGDPTGTAARELPLCSRT